MARPNEIIELEERLSQYTSLSVQLTLNNNRSTYLSVSKYPKKVIKISLHKLFLSASDEICRAIVEYALKGKKKALTMLRLYAHNYFQTNNQSHLIDTKKIQAKGNWVNLEEIYQRMNKKYFSDQLDLTIGWFNKPNYKRFSSVTFGSYTRHLRLIRINALLDHPKVPLYFIEFIVYHEMLHDVCPPQIDKAGRIRVHTSHFRKKEREYPMYEEAKQWEEQFLQRRGKYGRS